MTDNPIIQAMLNRKSIRKYTSESPTDEVIEAIVRAGQQAPFASQLYSLLLRRQDARHRNPFGAPLLFTICVDFFKFELIMARRGWKMVTNDLSLLLFGIQDAALMAENMVIAAESLNLGSCFLGGTPYRADDIARQYNLPQRVFPLVQLVIGYPAEDPPPRPRYPLDYTLFENAYPSFDEDEIEEAMRVMDEGYMAQNYYRNANLMIPLNEREETYTFETYGWTEHICRKWGQWFESPEEILQQLAGRGFVIGGAVEDTGENEEER